MDHDFAFVISGGKVYSKAARPKYLCYADRANTVCQPHLSSSRQ